MVLGTSSIGRSTPGTEEATSDVRGFDDFDLRLGDLMRGERATLGKSLLDVQRELKIKASYIAAIENADPTAFETQGFIAGYVRSYARYLGMDPEWAYAKFCEEGSFVVAHGMDPAASIQRKELPQRKGKVDSLANPVTPFSPRPTAALAKIEPGALGSIAVLVSLIGVLGYGGWYLLREVQRVQFAPIEQAPVVASEMGDGGVIDASPALPEITGSTSATPSLEALDRLYRPNPLAVPVMTPRDGPISTIDPNATGTLAALAPQVEEEAGNATDAAVAEALGLSADETPGPQVFEAAPGQLTLVAVRPSWIQVQSPDGTVLFERILDKGDTYQVPQLEEAAKLRTGNGGGLYVAVDGKTFGPVGADGEVVKNVALAIDNVTEVYAEADLTSDTDLADVVKVAQNQVGQ